MVFACASGTAETLVACTTESARYRRGRSLLHPVACYVAAINMRITWYHLNDAVREIASAKPDRIRQIYPRLLQSEDTDKYHFGGPSRRSHRRDATRRFPFLAARNMPLYPCHVALLWISINDNVRVGSPSVTYLER